jgi:hypothetical protein
MSQITIKIHSAENKSEIAKTLTVDGYELMLGTIEDFMSIIDLDKINDKGEVGKMVVKGFGQIKPLLKDIFPELTDDDFRNVSFSDMVKVIMDVGTAVVDDLDVFKSGN